MKYILKRRRGQKRKKFKYCGNNLEPAKEFVENAKTFLQVAQEILKNKNMI